MLVNLVIECVDIIFEGVFDVLVVVVVIEYVGYKVCVVIIELVI